ncbi:hypothetical protein ASPVEDRAFT_172748 [Aspergillus versicolor CBS 583.65]|uniref:Major facilitator superfamily (MFS) profile domain-containing protein n=1 Tax=Aspergillus versicolor CBS 583.65 TaxID=1036611 RepID=A0A1L9PSI3_ASPVE|nr:uncharacterized protein ASPVEDRAFT_172748 [Aspergillus versicolor CBS 583.65]OJJ04489.1 hypothetical protein ASPVEDRAFT_172748 [Aspergillus versicolor CBS 583.65]
MAILDKVHSVVGKTESATVDDPIALHVRADDKEAAPGFPEDLKDEKPAENAQSGVQKIEAVTLAWSKSSVYVLLVLIWFITLVNNLRGVVVDSLSPYATSSFLGHSLLTVITVVASSMAGAVYIPMAKALDLWGRAEGFLVMLGFCILGIILLSVSKNLPTYCAGQVFYQVGFGGLSFSYDVLSADVTNLRNRGLAFAFTSSPALISAFAGSKAAEQFLNHVSWRWGIGVWGIILPAFGIPIYLMLAWNLHKATKKGFIVKEKKHWSITPDAIKRGIWWTFIEFDLPGVILFAAGMVVFLLPFTLAASAPSGWRSGYIIAMIVVGFVLLILFGLWEIYAAPIPFLKHQYLTDRTVLGACLLNLTYQISYFCYSSYLTSFLQVVYEVDVATAGYVANTFSVVSFVFLFIAGWLIRWTGRFKWILWACLPLYIFGLGLMIHFRQPGGYIGYIVMCEVFISVSGSIFILLCQIAVLATVDHQHVSAVLALLFVMGNIGGGIGSAISGAIWTNTFGAKLSRNLPAEVMGDYALIYGDLPTQLGYAPGTEVRDVLNDAYGYAQVRMLAAGTAVMVLGFVWIGMIRNLNVKTMSQTRGNVL